MVLFVALPLMVMPLLPFGIAAVPAAFVPM